MPAEILGKPPPTPHPDQAGQASGSGEQTTPPCEIPDFNDQADSDEHAYDSCLDDLNVMLAQPVTEPDPALQSRSTAEEGSRAAKRTSELFETAGSLFGMGGPIRAKSRGM